MKILKNLSPFSLKKLILCLVIAVLLSPPVFAVENDVLITAGPSWENFTNRNGRGLYHDIIAAIFPNHTVRHLYVSTEQANDMVAIGRADIKMCETIPFEVASLLLSSIPMYENAYYVVFLRERIGGWEGASSLQEKRVAWREGYYSQVDFPVKVNSIEVRKGEAALKMVILGRADFYVDDMTLIKQSFANIEEKIDTEKFGIEKVGVRGYFPVFAQSERGRMLKGKYEKRMERLFQSGALQQIYQTWGFPVPGLVFAKEKR